MNDQNQAAETAVTLPDAERQPCEVWTRVKGYHRPVTSFNAGKKAEHRDRRAVQQVRIPSGVSPLRRTGFDLDQETALRFPRRGRIMKFRSRFYAAR